MFFFSYFVVGSGCKISAPISRPSFTENIGIWEEIALKSWEIVNATPDGIKVIGQCSESNFSLIDIFPCVDIVEEVLVIGVLLIPLYVVIVAEIVSH